MESSAASVKENNNPYSQVIVERSDPRMVAASFAPSQTLLQEQFGTPQITDTRQTNSDMLIAKLPWEHPSSPEDAANRAVQAISAMGGNPLAYAEAARWLNDGNQDFKTRAANDFNAQQVHVLSPSTRERCLVQAQKQNGEVSVRETQCD